MKRSKRESHRKNADLQKRLISYSAAAGAAGLAAVPGAQANIVYTPANVLVQQTSVGAGPQYYSLDLNNDSIVDFTLFNWWYKDNQSTPWSSFEPSTGNNGVINNVPPPPYSGFYAAHLSLGASIGSGGPFQTYSGSNYGTLDYSTDGSTHNGSWAGLDGYAGLKFDIGGQIHYGWVELNVGSVVDGLPITVEGYAYETTPNQGILAGQTLEAVPEPSSLGMMALGAVGLLAYRKSRKAA